LPGFEVLRCHVSAPIQGRAAAAAVFYACSTAFELCNDVVTGTEFVDGNIDGAEIQAAYENGKKALDNQLVRNRAAVKLKRKKLTNILSEVDGCVAVWCSEL
jgi:hypothetical protein